MSLPEKFRPLPGRRTLVLTLNKEFQHLGCEIFHSKDDLLQKMKEESLDDLWILGGGQIYKLFLPDSDHLHLTLVHSEFPHADTFFPEFEQLGFKKISEENPIKSEKDTHSVSFTVWEK